MSTSLVHVLTIIGNAAQDAEAVCEELLARRKPRAGGGYGSSDWSAQDHADIQAFCLRLIAAAHELPILYYAQYLDPWTVADSRFALLPWPDERRRLFCGGDHGIAFYPAQIADAILGQIAENAPRAQREDRWYLDQLKNAIEAALWLKAPFLVVAISRCLGGSRQDDEIKAALDLPLGGGNSQETP